MVASKSSSLLAVARFSSCLFPLWSHSVRICYCFLFSKIYNWNLIWFSSHSKGSGPLSHTCTQKKRRCVFSAAINAMNKRYWFIKERAYSLYAVWCMLGQFSLSFKHATMNRFRPFAVQYLPLTILMIVVINSSFVSLCPNTAHTIASFFELINHLQ